MELIATYFSDKIIQRILMLMISRIYLPGNVVCAQMVSDNDSLKYAEFRFYIENEYCFGCHGNEYYFLYDSLNKLKVKKLMCPDLRVGRDEFYQSNHKSFACLDCHSELRKDYPHKVKGIPEEIYSCLDCHGGVKQHEKYRFEEIESEYNRSIHAGIDGFSCWKCHDAHSYRITARTGSKIRGVIKYDNNICLECHGNYQNFKSLTDREEINMIEKHDWLPNQKAHFSNLRCIECHTRINDSLLVTHEILPGKEAVRKCVECHTSDSRLITSLYKFRRKDERRKGFINGVLINESFVIGANRNIYLNVLSLIITGFILLIILVHIIFRIIILKKK